MKLDRPLLGSEAQKQRWLPDMARLEKLGAFALTEPDHGSDSVALGDLRRAVTGDSRLVINGTKRWIGNGSVADVIVVWARGRGRPSPGLPGGEHVPPAHARLATLE